MQKYKFNLWFQNWMEFLWNVLPFGFGTVNFLEKITYICVCLNCFFVKIIICLVLILVLKNCFEQK